MADNKRVGSGGAKGGGKGRSGARQPVAQKRGGPVAPGGGARRAGGSPSANPGGGYRKTGGSAPAGAGRGAGKPATRSVRPASSGGGAGYDRDNRRPTGRPEYSRPDNRTNSRPDNRPDNRSEAPRRPSRPAPAGGAGYDRDRRPTGRPEYSRPDNRPYNRDEAPRRPSGDRYERPGRPERSGRPTEPRPPRTEHGERSAEAFGRTDERPVMQDMDEKVMGLNPVIELLRSGGRPVGTILIDHEKGGKQFEEIIGLARVKGITVKMVPKSALDSLSGLLRHQGAIAIVAPKEYSDPYAIVEEALKNKKAPIVLVLDGVEDPHNLGAVIRTAESAGVDCVIIPEHRAAHLTAAVARASAGALEHMPVGKVTNLVNYIDFLKEKGFWVIGLSGESKKDYTAFDMTVPIAAVMGSEGTGIRPIVEKACDEVVSLPMMGKVSSLNVSVAAGVLLYEVVRQRKVALAKS